MFSFNIILINPREDELRTWYIKAGSSSVPIYTQDFSRSKTELHFISKDLNIEMQLEVIKQLANRYPGLPILLLEITHSVENTAKPKIIIKEWKNGEVTVKDKGTKSSKAEDFAFINDLPEEMINQFMTQPIEPAAPTTATIAQQTTTATPTATTPFTTWTLNTNG